MPPLCLHSGDSRQPLGDSQGPEVVWEQLRFADALDRGVKLTGQSLAWSGRG